MPSRSSAPIPYSLLLAPARFGRPRAFTRFVESWLTRRSNFSKWAKSARTQKSLRNCEGNLCSWVRSRRRKVSVIASEPLGERGNLPIKKRLLRSLRELATTRCNVIKSRSFAPVAQWTECRPPEPESAVRVCAGAPANKSSRRKAVFALGYL